MPNRRFLNLIVLSSAVVGVRVAALQENTQTPAAEKPAAPASPDAVRIDEILTRLQARSDGLKDIRCNVRFVEDDQINLARRTKTGRVLFQMTDPNPLFMIHFASTEMDGVAGKREWYLFDGQWLHQAIERTAQVTKQELARPGDKLDFFDLEKAPFPLPFGQKKESILRNFDVVLAPPAAGDPPETDHLVCIPKPDSRLYRNYQRIEFFVNRIVNLPSRIVVTKSDGMEINTADFPDLNPASINVGLKPGDFDKPAEWKNYKEVVEELLEPAKRQE